MAEPGRDRAGWVYVLTNPAFPGLVKIGHTGRTPEVRAAELSAGTGIPAPFVVAWAHQVTDHEALEGIVHDRLSDCRPNGNREFFRCDVAKARRVIEREAAALLLPWWRGWLRRLVHPAPARRSVFWRTPPSRTAWRRRSGTDAGAYMALAGIAAGAVLLFRPGWVPPGLLHLLARLPGF